MLIPVQVGQVKVNKIWCLVCIYRKTPRVATGRYSADRRTMVRLVPAENFMTSCVKPGKLDRIFKGRGPAKRKECFVQIAGADFSQLFSQFATDFCDAAWRYIA